MCYLCTRVYLVTWVGIAIQLYTKSVQKIRGQVIKNVLYLEVTCLGPLQSILLPQRTHLSQRCFHFLKQSRYAFRDGFQLLRRICLNLRNRLKSSSFEGFFKFREQERVTRSKVRWVGRVGKNSDWVFGHKLNSRVLSAEWAGELSWWKNQLSLLHSSGLLCRTVSLTRFSTSIY